MDDLYATYVTRLQKQEEAFKIEAVSPFQSVEIQTNSEGFEWERLGIGRKDDTEYHLHNQVEEIFPELLDFAALLSFIPMEKRKNWNLLRLLFVIKFSKSKQSQITEVVNNFIIKFIQEGIFNPDVEPGFLLNVCSSVPLNIILSDYLNIMMDLSSISAQFDTIFPIYYNFISKQVKTEVILQFLNKTLDLYHLFQRTRKEKKDLLRIYQKRHFKSFFTTNYGKLGLSTFLTEIYLHPSTNSQNNLVTDLFGSLPFITQLFLQNGKIILYLVLPFDALPIFRDYLKRLQHVDLITHFYILPLKSYESNIYLNRNQNKNTYVNSFLPFSGRQWFLFNRPLQKLSNLIDTQYSQKINYTPSCNELVITPIHLLLVLSKSEIFQNLYSFSNMRDFLSNAKNVISSKV